MTVTLPGGKELLIIKEKLHYTSLPAGWSSLDGPPCMNVTDGGLVIPYAEENSGVQTTLQTDPGCDHRLCFTILEINGEVVLTVTGGYGEGFGGGGMMTAFAGEEESELYSVEITDAGEVCIDITEGTYSSLTLTFETVEGENITLANVELEEICSKYSQVADVLTAQDYYPFGMQMPGRQYNSPSYRYKHQGQESDDEIAGTGNVYAYKHRTSDARLGRFWSIDPLYKKYPYWSPYAFSGNRVIDAIEMEGLQPERVTETAEDYDGTPYEFGGKDPAFEGGLPEGMTEEWYLDNVGWLSSNNGSRYNNPNYDNEVNLNQYLTDGATSCGMDCSGLAGTAFNADEQKLMGDFNLYSQNAAAQRQAFRNADATEGFLGDNFDNVNQGDLVFNEAATHVMVATGQARTNDAGQTQIQVVHAPQTGEYVGTEWRTIGEDWSYGHTFRTTDNVLPEVEITADRE